MMSEGSARQVSPQHTSTTNCKQNCLQYVATLGQYRTWRDFQFVLFACFRLTMRERPRFVCTPPTRTWFTQHMPVDAKADNHAVECRLAISSTSPRHHAFINLQITATWGEKGLFSWSAEHRHFLSFRLIATLLRHSYISPNWILHDTSCLLWRARRDACSPHFHQDTGS